MPVQRQQAQAKNQPAGIDRVRSVRVPIMQKAMREGVSKVGAGLSEEHTLNVGRISSCQNAVELGTHLLEQRRYRSILLCLGRVVKNCDIVAIALQHVSQQVFQQWREDVNRANEVSLKEARVAPCKGVNEVRWNEGAVLHKGDEDIVCDEMLFKYRMSGCLDLPQATNFLRMSSPCAIC